MSTASWKKLAASAGMALVLCAAAPAVSYASAASDPQTSDEVDGIGPTLNEGTPIQEGRMFVGGADEPAVIRPNVVTPNAAVFREYSPAGCTGTTMYPHKSGDSASVHGRTICNRQVGFVSTTTTLKRDRWYGLQQLGDPVTIFRNNNTHSYDAAPHWRCYGTGTYTYRGYSRHVSVEFGRTYSASTANWQVPGISRFYC